jgi:hypothetical protein
MRYLKLLLVIFLVSGCLPSSDDGPPAPTAVLTPTGPAQALPIDTSGIPNGFFRFKYLDPTSGEFQTVNGSAYYSIVPNLQDGALPNMISDNPAVNPARVVFSLPDGLAPGSYHLIEYSAAFSADNRSVVVYGATLVDVANYFEVQRGTLTVTAVDPLTAAFEFTGLAEVSETKTVEVTVEGTLNAVPYLAIPQAPGPGG